MISEIEIENLDSLYLRKNIDNRYIQILIQIKIWLESKSEYREEYFLIIEGHQKKKKETKRKHSDARYTPNQWEQQAKKI